jgi:hypothetical protein
MTIPLKKDEGSYSYSLRAGRESDLLMGVRSVQL